MNYERINWENAPSTDTPLDADNLNKMDEALDTLNREVAKTRSDVQEVEETAASLGSQIAGIIRLEDGSTTGDAELINGRVGKDGTTYQTIGDAIRGQIGDLRDHVIEVSGEEPEEFYNKIWVKDDDQEIEIPTKAELDAVEDEVAELNERLSNVKEGIYLNAENAVLTNNTIATNGEIGSTVSYTESVDTGWSHTVVNCSTGDTFLIRGQGGSTPRLWCFVDTDDKIVSQASASAIYEGEIIAPCDGRMIYNSVKSYGNLYVKYKKASKTVLYDLQNYIDGQSNIVNVNYYPLIKKDHVMYTGSVNIGSVIDSKQYFKTLGIGSVDIPCDKDDRFVICGKTSDTGGNFRLWCFCDSSYTILSRSNVSEVNVTSSPKTLIAPENAKHLIINFDDYDGSYINKIYIDDNTIKDFVSEGNNNLVNEQLVPNTYQSVNYTNKIIRNKTVYLAVNVGATIGSPYNSQTFSYVEIPCEAGDIFELKGATAPLNPMWAFADNDRKLILRGTGEWWDTNAYDYPVKLLAPSESKLLICIFDLADYPNSYIVKVGKTIADSKNTSKIFVNNKKYVMPEYGGIAEILDKSHTQSKDSYNFSQFYQLFHALVTTDILEEINMSTEYLAHNTDAIPSDISSITDGGMYMYHVIPPTGCGTAYGFQHRKMKLFIVAGLHGSEKKSIWDTYHLLKDFIDGERNRALYILRNFADIYVVPLACPDGIENNTRLKSNGVNLNRDFNVLNWAKVEDSANAPNSQYETRCISWWLEQINPDIVVDHHTSEGNSATEGGKFVAWGSSDITIIASTIDETIMDCTPYIKDYVTALSSYNHVFGFSRALEQWTMSYGMLEKYACQHGMIGTTFEVVMAVRWDGNLLIGFSDADESKMMSIDYYVFLNYLIKLMKQSVELKNGDVAMVDFTNIVFS